MKDIALVILAAGIGSRYGGLKQIDAVGDNGEAIIDFSIYDAIAAGFSKVYLIIKEEHRALFAQNIGDKLEKFIRVEYVYQNLNDLPPGFDLPAGRSKPWGTTQALLACRGIVKEPFAIINADDYYGKSAFTKIFDFLENEVGQYNYGMVGFKCANTLSDAGAVTRALCHEKAGYLSSIEELQKVFRQNGEICYESAEGLRYLSGQEPVSMNFWGFEPSIFDLLTAVFTRFLQRECQNDPLKCEHVIPTAIAELIKTTAVRVKVLTSSDNWYGITYQEDKPQIVAAIQKMKDEDLYPQKLWEIK